MTAPPTGPDVPPECFTVLRQIASEVQRQSVYDADLPSVWMPADLVEIASNLTTAEWPGNQDRQCLTQAAALLVRAIVGIDEREAAKV